jgi:hypothetical protein
VIPGTSRSRCSVDCALVFCEQQLVVAELIPLSFRLVVTSFDAFNS